MTSSELSPGLLVDGIVRLVRLLGEGGMGSVWVADHLRLGTQVAVKFLSTTLSKDAGPIMRFQHEAMMAAQLKSRHVVQIYDQGVFDGDRPYIVMELLEGEDLSRRLAREGPLSPGQLARVVSETCAALSKAHLKGIVHRDVKPDNIFLVDEEGESFVKVLDFGIAKRTDAPTSMVVTDTGAMIGTPYYMSPEQMLDLKQVDFRADLWSLGVVAYHCLVGTHPFEGKTIGGLCVAIEKGVFAPPSRLRPGLPPAIDAWFTRALHRDPANRFASAREMAEAFVAAVEGTKADAPATKRDVSPASTDAPATKREVSPASSDAPSTKREVSPASSDAPSTKREVSPASTDAPVASRGGPPASVDARRASANAFGETVPSTPRERIWSSPESELEQWFTSAPASDSKTPPAVTTSIVFDEGPADEPRASEPSPTRPSRDRVSAPEASLTQLSPAAEAPPSAAAPALAAGSTPVSVGARRRAAPPAPRAPDDDAPIDDALLLAASVPSPRRTRRNVARLVAFGVAMFATALGTSAVLAPERVRASFLSMAGRPTGAPPPSAQAPVKAPPPAPSASAEPAPSAARPPRAPSPKGAPRGQAPAARANAASAPNAFANEGPSNASTRRSTHPARAGASAPMAFFLKAPPEAEPAASAPPAPEAGPPGAPAPAADAAGPPNAPAPPPDKAGGSTPSSPDKAAGPTPPPLAPPPEPGPAASGQSLLFAPARAPGRQATAKNPVKSKC